MIKLKSSKVWQREIRQDDLKELGIPTWQLVRDAIQAGKTEEALHLLDYCRGENQRNNDSFASSAETAYNYIATFGEEKLGKLLRERFYEKTKARLASAPSVEETVQMCAELQRGHGGSFTIREEPDRYVVTLDPCGSGGKLRRTRSVGTTKKAYPWSWNKVGVPYYCCHCCLGWEIIPIELRGYPIRVVLIGDRPEDPCTALYYKKPELIPEEYFVRVGKTKTIK